MALLIAASPLPKSWTSDEPSKLDSMALHIDQMHEARVAWARGCDTMGLEFGMWGLDSGSAVPGWAGPEQ